ELDRLAGARERAALGLLDSVDDFLVTAERCELRSTLANDNVLGIAQVARDAVARRGNAEKNRLRRMREPPRQPTLERAPPERVDVEERVVGYHIYVRVVRD